MPTSPGPFDVFISYSRKDNQSGWVTALRDLIVANAQVAGQPVRLFFDTDDIGSEQDWRHRILSGLRYSKVLLVCLSPNYFTSDYCRWEWQHFLQRQGKRNLQGDGESIQSLRLVQLSESHAPDANWLASVRRSSTLDLSPWFAVSPEIFNAPGPAQSEALKVVDALKKRIAAARGNLAREYGNLRAANSHFVGRHKQLKKLHEAVGVGKLGVITALHGLGGIGKTELAIQYANEYARSFSGGIWWIDAAPFSSSAQAENSLELLKQAIAHLADELETPPPKLGNDANAPFAYVIRTLRSHSERQRLTDPDGTAQVLILLDNVEDSALLGANQRSLIGNCPWLSLLATTRNASEEWQRADDLEVISLDGLDPEDAMALMREWQKNHVFRDKTDEDAARSLVESLDYYTLAVEQAAIYVGLKPEISIAGFLERLRVKGLAELDVLAARDPQLRSTIQHREKQLSLVLEQTLPEIGTSARQILSYAALFDPDAIAKPWLETLMLEHHCDKLECESFADAWRWLENRRLVTPTNVAEVWRMHRLVCGFVRDNSKQTAGRFNALVTQQISAQKAEVMSSESPLWYLDVLVAWVTQVSDKHRLWTRVRSFLASEFATMKKFSFGEQILKPTLTYLEALHLENPQSSQRTRAYANALELSATIRQQMGNYLNLNLLGQQVIALRESLVLAMPDVTRYAQELSESTKYFGTVIAEANRFRPVVDELFRNSLTNVLPVADEIFRATRSVNIDMSESNRALGMQLSGIPSLVNPVLDHGRRQSELIHSLDAGLTDLYSFQSATKSAFDEVQKQIRASSHINDLINVDSWRPFISNRYLPMSAAEARAKRRDAKIEYAKFIRHGDSDCLEVIDDTFEQLSQELKYISNTDRRIWKHVRAELRGESDH